MHYWVNLIVIVTILFIALVSHGLKSAGVGGFILSLIPPMAIFVIGFCVNWHKIAANFYHNVLAYSSTSAAGPTHDSNHTSGNINNQADETTPLIQRYVAIDMEDDEENQ